MEKEVLRSRIIKTYNEGNQNFDSKLFPFLVAEYLVGMLGFINNGNLGDYGDALDIKDINELKKLASEIKEDLRKELSEEKWNTFFKPKNRNLK